MAGCLAELYDGFKGHGQSETGSMNSLACGMFFSTSWQKATRNASRAVGRRLMEAGIPPGSDPFSLDGFAEETAADPAGNMRSLGGTLAAVLFPRAPGARPRLLSASPALPDPCGPAGAKSSPELSGRLHHFADSTMPLLVMAPREKSCGPFQGRMTSDLNREVRLPRPCESRSSNAAGCSPRS